MTDRGTLPSALCLMGPTASGKTWVAIDLARHHGYEIISVDSALVYRDMDIGTGKPDRAILAEIPHRLVDIRDPAEPYSASEFREDAVAGMEEILAAGKKPLLVGGTMLYFKTLRDGLAAMPSASQEIRRQILDLASQNGWQAVHARLAEVDPASARRIHPNDPQRLQRALEVFLATGRSMTEHHRQEQAAGATDDLPCELVFCAIAPAERATLHQKIADRFDSMLREGFVAEVEALRARGDLNPALPAIRAVGYRQVWDYLDGKTDYDTMKIKGIAATRQLAKRQFTWLRSWPNLCTLDSESVNIVENCLKVMAPDAIK